jgi:hypothetical protein
MSLSTSHAATFEVAGDADDPAGSSVFEKSQLRQTQTGAMNGEGR